MEDENFLAVLDLIHEAAVHPSGWDPVLRRLASLTGCVAGGLTVERPATRQGAPLTYFGFDPGHVRRTFDHYLPMNPLFRIEPRMQPGFVVANGDVVEVRTFRNSEFYNGWARPQGLCSPVTVVIHRTEAFYVPLTLVRPDGAGEVTSEGRAMLSRLARHLVHAMNVTVRLHAASEARREAAMVLEKLPCGALLLDRERRVIFANAVAENLLGRTGGGVLGCVSGELRISDVEMDGQFQAAISAALGIGGLPEGSQIPVQSPAGEGRLTVMLSPLPASGEGWSALSDDFAKQARCLVLISGTNVANLAEQYGLTPAETRMLSAIVVGKGLNSAARELGIARSTAQTHLDRIFQKTGTNRQAELVGLAKSGFGS